MNFFRKIFNKILLFFKRKDIKLLNEINENEISKLENIEQIEFSKEKEDNIFEFNFDKELLELVKIYKEKQNIINIKKQKLLKLDEEIEKLSNKDDVLF